MPYLSALEVCSRRGAIQIHVYHLPFTMACGDVTGSKRIKSAVGINSSPASSDGGKDDMNADAISSAITKYNADITEICIHWYSHTNTLVHYTVLRATVTHTVS